MLHFTCIHRKKRFSSFPSPVPVYQTLPGGNNENITELSLPRGSLVSDIPAGDGKLVNLFLRCIGCINDIMKNIGQYESVVPVKSNKRIDCVVKCER